MPEAIKAVILDRGEHKIDGTKVYAYLFAFTLISDKPIDDFIKPGCYSMGEFKSNPITEVFSKLPKAEPEYTLSEISSELLNVSNMSVEQFNKLMENNNDKNTN